LGLVVGVLGIAFGLLPIGVALEEDVGLHGLFRLRGTVTPPSDVAIVAMDRTSAEALGLPHDFRRWPRRLHARLVETLIRCGASAIVFDVFFAEEQNPQDDAALAAAFVSASNVILFEYFRTDYFQVKGMSQRGGDGLSVEQFQTPLRFIADAAVALAPFPLPKVPVKVTRYWRFLGRAGDRPTMPAAAFQLFARDAYELFAELFNRHVHSPSVAIPTDSNALMSARSMERVMVQVRRQFADQPELADRMLRELKEIRGTGLDERGSIRLQALIEMYRHADDQLLNFYGPPGTVARIPFHELVQAWGEPSRELNLPDLRGKTVFVGACELVSVDNKDGFHTVFSQPNGITLSGVEIAATAFANLLENKPVQPVASMTRAAVILLWGLLLAVFTLFLPTIWAVSSLAGAALAFLAAVSAQFAANAVWFPVLIPVLIQPPLAFVGGVLWKYLDERRERRHIRHAFGLYLPDRVVDQVVEDIRHNRVSEQVVSGAVLCSDGARYSTLSEAMSPEELSAFMNGYFETIFRSVHGHGGTVCDVVGDSMMALWSAVDPDPDLRMRSCLAALDIALAVEHFNGLQGTHRLHTRMGLHHGRVSIGNVGGAGHYEYRAVGDVVNTAARIEGVNKQVGTQILVSEEVLDHVDRFHTRRLGRFLLVGKIRPTVIHELVCRREEASAAQKELAALFEEALTDYAARNWERAARRFQEVLQINPDDGAARFYLPLCKANTLESPDESWDGVVRLNSK
jgi:adenylate cyclase